MTVMIRYPRDWAFPAYGEAVVREMFQTYARVELKKEFTEGQSNTHVYLIQPYRQEYDRELPTVIKLGPADLIQQEWNASQQYARNRLAGFVAVEGEPVWVSDPNSTEPLYGGLRYALSGDGLFQTETLRHYATHASAPDLWTVLHTRLLKQLDGIWQSNPTRETRSVRASYDGVLPVNLLVRPLAENEQASSVRLIDAMHIQQSSPYLQPIRSGMTVQMRGFVVAEVDIESKCVTLNLPQHPDRFSDSYRIRLIDIVDLASYHPGEETALINGVVTMTRQELLTQYVQKGVNLGEEIEQTTLALPGQSAKLPNPLQAWPDLLHQILPMKLALIHGDLNMGNVLIDPEARTAQIIDCIHARRDHVLFDLLRLEMEALLHPLAALFFRQNLPPTAIHGLYLRVHAVATADPHPPGQFALPTDLHPALEPLFVLLVTIRGAVREYLATAGKWQEYYTLLTIYLLGALKFKSLDHVPTGHEPRAIAFWGAATTLHLLRDPAQAAGRLLQEIGWRFFDVTTGSMVADDPSSNLESYAKSPIPTESLGESTGAAAVVPTQRRLDVAAPEAATLGRAFSIAVAIRQHQSPVLALTELPEVQSGDAQLHWPDVEPFVRLRVQIMAPDCEIAGGDTHSFKLYRNLDSEIFYFSLTPKTTGRLSIAVRLYQEEDMLGSALAYTTVGEQVVSELKVQLQSSAPLAVAQETAAIARRSAVPTANRADEPIKILFLAANPLDTARLRIDEEARAIDLALRQAEYRHFEILVHQAVRSDDLQGLLLRHRPDIVHFSGHGSETNELLLQDHSGNAVALSNRALQGLFRVLKDNIRCVILNACFSKVQAVGIAGVIDYVVGITDDVEDEASIQFATAFYRALGYGRSIQEAFDLGQLQIELAGLGQSDALQLVTQREDAQTASFVDTSANNIEHTASAPTSATATPSTATPSTSLQSNPDPSPEQAFLQTLLAQHRRNLQRLREQKATFGAGEEPLRLLNQIDAETAEIAKIEEQLRNI